MTRPVGGRMRLRDLGVVIGGLAPGPNNAITDVPGVRVGHTTLVEGDGPLVVGRGPVRTGVTVIVPYEGAIRDEEFFAGCHRLNGAGDMTGLEWVRESGRLSGPLAITNTNSLGLVRDTIIGILSRGHVGESWFAMPVVGETYDGHLNDIAGMHVRPEHVEAALVDARGGPVPEGNVGGGTGMLLHGFKGGIGTSSRQVVTPAGTHTVGVLVQANYGSRERLHVAGVPVGRAVPPSRVPLPFPGGEVAEPAVPGGSIVAVVATDAPLLPHQCTRLAQRAGLGVARAGGVAAHHSGDLFFAFSTGNRGAIGPDFGTDGPPIDRVEFVSDRYLSKLFEGVVDATEEAIANVLLAADTMVGRDGVTAHALDADLLAEVLSTHGSPLLREGPG